MKGFNSKLPEGYPDLQRLIKAGGHCGGNLDSNNGDEDNSPRENNVNNDNS